MSVEFDQDQMSNTFRSRQIIGEPKVPGMARWLVSKGIIKEEANAKFILLGVFIFDIIATGVIIYLYL